jgi:hypothetical protein
MTTISTRERKRQIQTQWQRNCSADLGKYISGFHSDEGHYATKTIRLGKALGNPQGPGRRSTLLSFISNYNSFYRSYSEMPNLN